jgi:hypothetical protein
MSGWPKPLLRGVASTGFQLRYLDSAAHPIDANDAQARRRIAAVQITLKMQAGNSGTSANIERTIAMRNL